jgi:hypothetical protein
MSRELHLVEVSVALAMARKLHRLPYEMYAEENFRAGMVNRLSINEMTMTAALARKFMEIEPE